MKHLSTLAGLWTLATSAASVHGGSYESEVSFGNNGVVALRMFIPNGLAAVRGVALHLPGYNGDDRKMADWPIWQEACREWGFALAGGMLKGSNYSDPESGSAEALEKALAMIGMESGHPELAQVPMVLKGFSEGGKTCYAYSGARPERVVAFVNGKSGRSLDRDIAARDGIPGLLLYSEKDKPIVFEKMSNLMAAHRPLGAPWALGVDWGFAHDPGRMDDYALAFFHSAIRLRMGTTDTALRPLDRSGSLRGFSPGAFSGAWVPTLAPGAPGPVEGETSFLLSKAFADVWRGFCTRDKEGIVTHPKRLSVIPSGDGIPMTGTNFTAGPADQGGTVTLQVDGEEVATAPIEHGEFKATVHLKPGLHSLVALRTGPNPRTTAPIVFVVK